MGSKDDASAATEGSSSRLRFAVGDRVACNLGAAHGWAPGVIVAVQYREEHWPKEKVAPYQIQLDVSFGGSLIYAPADTSKVIRREAEAPQPTESFPSRAWPADAEAALRTARAEVASAAALPFVASVAAPRPLGRATDSDGELRAATDATGPWYVEAVLRGEEGSAYDAAYVVRVKFNALWPQTPAELRFCSTVHHALIDDEGFVPPDTLADAVLACETAPAERDVESQAAEASGPPAPAGSQRKGLCSVLAAAHLLLTKPECLLSQAHWVMQEGAAEANKERLDVIAAYEPLRSCRALFEAGGWASEWFAPALREALASSDSEASWRALVREESWDVYSFPLFTAAFCDIFVEEVYSFYKSGLPARRPNSMNNYGIVVNEIGMEAALGQLQRDVLQSLARVLFPGPGSELDYHHSFIVRYKMGEDLGLDMHTDDSDVTFNVCLGRDFKGAGLQFCGNQGSKHHRRASKVYLHEKGRCVVHLGHRRHGADDITEGERLNLIVWNRSSEYRRSRDYKRYNMQGATSGYEQEDGQPDAVCLSATHDRDYGVFREYSERNQELRGKGWCPPAHAEYQGFRAESRRRSAAAA